MRLSGADELAQGGGYRLARVGVEERVVHRPQHFRVVDFVPVALDPKACRDAMEPQEVLCPIGDKGGTRAVPRHDQARSQVGSGVRRRRKRGLGRRFTGQALRGARGDEQHSASRAAVLI
eukprot:scaffold29134_cov73-Phaeocystis_antarctica.AAC.1